jgi:hypothetical protein
MNTDVTKYILNKEVYVTINNWNIEHFIKLKYSKLKINLKILIPVHHLMKYSSVKVDCFCSICGKTQTITFQKYMNNYERSGFYSCKHCNNETLKITMMNKYGVKNCANLEKSIEKRKSTCFEKYGNEYVIASNEIRKKIKNVLFEKYGGHQTMNDDIMKKIISKGKITKIIKGLIISDDKLSEWKLYKRNVRRMTEKNRAFLLKNWDGFDFYDNQYIKENFILPHIDRNYPTLDHKTSIFYGFINNISLEEISDISNLCVTKRFINCIKSDLTEEQFKKREF